jgi:Aminoglycoside-2''-adenylyltransferase
MESFSELVKLSSLLNDFKQPWFVAGGWAIDLFIGDVTRVHKDIEITIFRKDQSRLREYLFGWEFTKVVNGKIEPWNEDEWLDLPIHEIHAHTKNPLFSELEILLDESSENEWRYRRNLDIARPLSIIRLRSDIDVPFLAPEIVLLYKAKNPRSKDEDDFYRVCRLLDEERQVWLKQAITVCHPRHHWLAELDAN